MIQRYQSIGDMFLTLVPTYKGRGWKPFLARFPWDRSVADHMQTVSARRCARRVETYIIPGELERSTQSIRFGHEKTGHGYKGERKDFCMVGGAYEKKHLTLFYRRLEMIGGLHYDLAVISHLEDHVGEIKSVTIMAVEAKVFALSGNSNEKLYNHLTDFYGGPK